MGGPLSSSPVFLPEAGAFDSCLWCVCKVVTGTFDTDSLYPVFCVLLCFHADSFSQERDKLKASRNDAARLAWNAVVGGRRLRAEAAEAVPNDLQSFLRLGSEFALLSCSELELLIKWTLYLERLNWWLINLPG